MSLEQIGDLIVVVASVAAVIIFYVYSKNRTIIDKKAEQGDLLAKAEKMVANSVDAIVYQTEKEGGDGKAKKVAAYNYLTAILDLAHLPHPSTAYVNGEIEKSVTTMKQAKSIVDTFDKTSITSKSEELGNDKTDKTQIVEPVIVEEHD